MKTFMLILALFAVSSVYFVNDSFAEISENQAFLLEGSGFAVTEEVIKISEIDLGLLSQDQRGSTIDFLTEDGFIILGEEDFIISNLEGEFLREGKYIRINGEIESSSGLDTSISFFGRLIDESKNASVYGFTGRITTSDDTFKVIYTAKLSTLSKINFTSIEPEKSNVNTLYILRGSSSQGIVDSYIDASTIRENSVAVQNIADPLRLRYFSQDRISIEPGTVITIVNNDLVSHSVISGKENYGDRHDPFTPDGRISTGEILPGNSVDIPLDDAGFYRLYDPNYPWMKIIAYVFPDSDSLTFGEGQNLGN
jgi:plastocyanin